MTNDNNIIIYQDDNEITRVSVRFIGVGSKRNSLCRIFNS